VDKIAAVFGEAILAPVRGLSDRMLEHYVFSQYNSTATIPIEVQVCQALEQQKLISVAYPRSEFRIWTDICQILFCQAFLYEYERNLWLFDEWEIREPSAVEKCWNNLRTYQVQHFLKEQWSFLEKLAPPYVAFQRRKYLLRRLLSNYLRTFNQGNQLPDDTVRGRENLLRTPLSYDLKTENQGNQSAQIQKCYSYYDNELLSPENLVIKKFIKESPPKYFPCNFSFGESRSSAVQKVPSVFNGPLKIPNIFRDDDLKSRLYDSDDGKTFRRYSDDGKTLFFRSYHMGKEHPFVIRGEATLKEGIDIDFQRICPIWHFQEPLIYYLDLLQCIDESSLFMLLEDLLSDFARPRAYYQENSKNVDLYPWRWGMPDIVAYDKENNFHVLLECKGPKNRLIKTQIRWLSRNLERYKLNVGLVVVNENQVGKL
jgi:hypothetical protein